MSKKEQGFVIWLGGIPASGKTTLAQNTVKALEEYNIDIEILDSEDIRNELSPDLGFTAKDRDQNTKRLAWMAKLLSKNGISVLIASGAVSREHRERVREYVDKYAIFYVQCPLSVCIKRDPKGLYKKIQDGTNRQLPGCVQSVEELDTKFQRPINPELTINTDKLSIKKCVQLIIDKLVDLQFLHILNKQAEENKD